MGCPVEIEFAADLAAAAEANTFSFLQIRPMIADIGMISVKISEEEISRAFCSSNQILGHGINDQITDIIFVRPESFQPGITRAVAKEISQFNARLQKKNRRYLLIGPGRWGSADPWLGIPVQWQDISSVSAIVELQNSGIKADPSQGTHFFQNITAMNIMYFTVADGAAPSQNNDSYLNWQWLQSQPVMKKSKYLSHIRLFVPCIIKVDFHSSKGVMYTQH
jgi:hypothetical protein